MQLSEPSQSMKPTRRLQENLSEFATTPRVAYLLLVRPMKPIVIVVITTAFSFATWSTTAVAQDPAVVNAKTIKVKFENDKVRVLEATLPPGVKEAVHSHPAYVIYVLEGGKYRNYASDGKTSEGELKTGEVLYRDPLTHAAENIGNTTMHMILVEMKNANGPTR